MPYILGIDIGTSATKTGLYDITGKTIATHSVSYPLHHPQNGWAEQDPADWWAAAVSSILWVLGHSGAPASEIAGVGLTGQMHGLVLLDENDEVIRPAILWCDQRSALECVQITDRVGKEQLLAITANPALTGFTASKLLWVRNNEPEAYARTKKVLLPKDYIRYKLTGAMVTDVSDASGMQMLDVGHRCWSREVLDALDIPIEWLPECLESPALSGRVNKDAAALTGLPPGTPVAAGAGDNAAAAVGTGVVREGVSFTTIGTSGVVFVHTDNMAIDPKGRIHTFCCAVPDAWHTMGVTQSAGFSLQWFRNQFCQSEIETARQLGKSTYKILDEVALLSPLGANRLLFMPYLQGERTPHLDSDVRGAFIGLSAAHGRRDMLRAVMEGVSFSMRDCAEVFTEIGLPLDQTRVCGGGGSSLLWRQMLADIMGLEVVTTGSNEGPTLGAAILAGVTAGLYPGVREACDAVISVTGSIAPIEPNREAYDRIYGLYREAYPALKGLYKELAKL